MGNIMDDFSISCSIILGIISFTCENCYFEQKTPGKKSTWLNLRDLLLLVKKVKFVISRKLFIAWNKHRVLGTQR